MCILDNVKYSYTDTSAYIVGFLPTPAMASSFPDYGNNRKWFWQSIHVRRIMFILIFRAYYDSITQK